MKNRLRNIILDGKIAFYDWAQQIWPSTFSSKYVRNYQKRYFNQTQTSVKYSFLAHAEENQDFSALHTDIKLMAYYLPQFHSFPENDAWWGKGFTEWTNTRPAKPRCPGHYQPREPHVDIGYYDLSDVQVMAKQAALAKQHGIYGFCMYYYWFSGKKLMEKPLDNLMKHPEIDFPFCLCWANENWSRRWDGSESEVLIAQKYSPQDPLLFVQDVFPYLQDKRYIRVNGKPIIIVYNIQHIPNPVQTFEVWRQYCREHSLGEIEIWGGRSFLKYYQQTFNGLVDREVEFPPHCVAPGETLEAFMCQKDRWINYQSIVDAVTSAKHPLPRANHPIIRAAMLGWDNTARHKNNRADVYNNFSLLSYYKWLRYLVDYTRKNLKKEERFLFVNAWNEWAEGTYLEPDRKYGYANINITSRAIYDLPFEPQVPIQAVIIACLESLGDIIACEPVIKAVQEKYPNRPVYWAVSAQYAEVLQAHPRLAGILPFYTLEQWQEFKQSLPGSVQIVDLHFHERHYLLANGGAFFNQNRKDITEANYYNCGNSLLDVFSKVAGLPSNNEAPHFYIAPFAKKPAFLPKKYIAVHVAASNEVRNWDIKKWKELLLVLDKHNIKVVELGQKPFLTDLPNCIDCTSLSSIHDTAAVLAGAELFIGIDSSLAHLANALNVPGVILLGKYYSFTRYMPYSGNYQKGINSQILYAKNDRPAFAITVAEVLAAVSKILQVKIA